MNIRRPMCYIAVGFLLSVSILIKTFQLLPNDYDVLESTEDGDTISFSGVVCDKSMSDEKNMLYIKHAFTDQISDIGIVAYVKEEGGALINDIPIGSSVSGVGRIYRYDEAENFGQFNSREYYYIRGWNARVMNCEILSYKGKIGIRETLWRVKNKIRRIYNSYLDETDAGIMTAVMLGDKTDLDKEIKNLYQLSGITHILSLSGLHIATLGLALISALKHIIQWLFLKTRLCNDMDNGGIKSSALAGVVASTLMALYCIMTGMNISTIRALIMFILGLMAEILGRSYDLLSAASFSSVIAVIINPLYIYDAGFQLSFAAVVSIGIIYPIFISLFDKAGNYKIIQGILLSLSIQVGTLPIVAYHYYRTSLMGIILNLLVVPLMSIVLSMGVVMAGFGDYLAVLCRIAAKITHIILYIYEKLSMMASDFKWNLLIMGKPKLVQIAAYYLLLMIALLYIVAIVKKEEKAKSSDRYYYYSPKKNHRNVDVNKLRPILNRLASAGLLLLGCTVIIAGHTDDFSVSNLSVGQGDCTVIRNDSHVIIVDCGSTSEKQVGTYRLIPWLTANRVMKIDTVFISHFDSDHVNGILEILDDKYYRGRIGKIVISGAAPLLDCTSENYVKLIETSKSYDIPIYTLWAGEGITVGDAVISCLSPVKDRVKEYADTNSASLILDITDILSGFRMLLTGDADFASEEKMYGALYGYDYLKVAHHGSNTSTSDEFLRKWVAKSGIYNGLIKINMNCQDIISPKSFFTNGKISVISVGEGNRYGHPGDELIERLHDFYNEKAVFRTDTMHEIDVKVR